jgi:hypothetical protein
MIDAIPVIGAFIDAAMDFAVEIAEWDVANLKACITEEWEDAVYCNLYCELGEDGIITDEVFTAFVQRCATMPLCILGLTLVGQVFALMLLAIGAQNCRNRAYIYASASSDCPPCEDCPDCGELVRIYGVEQETLFTVEHGTPNVADGEVSITGSGVISVICDLTCTRPVGVVQHWISVSAIMSAYNNHWDLLDADNNIIDTFLQNSGTDNVGHPPVTISHNFGGTLARKVRFYRSISTSGVTVMGGIQVTCEA